MGKFQVIDHPLIRDKNCGTKVFREVVDEIAMLMAYEVSRDMPLEDIVIETPITETTQKTLSGKKVAIIPILRAGIGMVDGILELIPAAKVGHIGLYRDEETFEPHEYFVKLPEDIDARQLFVVDPMLATGGSAIMAIDALKERGASNIKFVCLVAAPEGVKALQEAHPDIDIYTAAFSQLSFVYKKTIPKMQRWSNSNLFKFFVVNDYYTLALRHQVRIFCSFINLNNSGIFQLF